jgi:hypothetical protein
LPCSEPLQFFLQNKITLEAFELTILISQKMIDIISALKGWQRNDDFILATLSGMIINSDLLKIKLTSEKSSF